MRNGKARPKILEASPDPLPTESAVLPGLLCLHYAGSRRLPNTADGLEAWQPSRAWLDYRVRRTLQQIIQMNPGAAQNPLFDPEAAKTIAGLRGTIEGLRELMTRPPEKNVISDAANVAQSALEKATEVGKELVAAAREFATEAYNAALVTRDQIVAAWSRLGKGAGRAFVDAFRGEFGTGPIPPGFQVPSPFQQQREEERRGELTTPALTASTSVVNNYFELGGVDLTGDLSAETKRGLLSDLLRLLPREQAFRTATGGEVSA